MSRLSSPLNNPGGADAPAQPVGFSAFIQPVYSPYRPTARQLANEIPRLLKSVVNVASSIPSTDGFEFRGAANSQLQLTISGKYARRRRRVFGYVGDIQLAKEARGTVTPVHLEIVTTTPGGTGAILVYEG